jgi:hypothetical protein
MVCYLRLGPPREMGRFIICELKFMPERMMAIAVTMFVIAGVLLTISLL